MSINKLKSFAQRSSIFGVAVAVLAAVVLPSASVFADALNPLTERSLLLSSSAPGFQNTDGSGNSTDNLNANGQTFAPAGSGPNGRKTGETFTFRVSSDSTGRPIKGVTFQYCTTAAGVCQAPGNNLGDNSAGIEDRADNVDASFADGRSDLEVVYGAPVAGVNYKIYRGDAKTEVSDYTGWAMTTKNAEDEAHSDALTGKNNFITLTNTNEDFNPASGEKIVIDFIASETQYITNPGKGSFFVKINTYSSEIPANHIPGDQTYNIDGGVTVANVMTDSIHITTKVLETMSFSVGTRNRDTTTLTGVAVHGTCDPIEQVNNNRLDLGNPNAEYSLSTDTTYDVNSYWRLSSNSSGGASVYYSGNTLANTVGDEIAEAGPVAQESTAGTEQFGLAFTNAGLVSGAPAAGETGDTFSTAFTGLVNSTPLRYKYPTLQLAGSTYLQPETPYENGDGEINRPDNDPLVSNEPYTNPASFAFVKSSNTVPALIAENDSMVISCATAKMRYIANIGADTPAGVYTTKINYLAAPQY